ncbi:pyridoxamine 5'-phosphate oxidase family protein [Candidatus Dependentiae bacterium]|nr:pyridoxamine 5'-phosphate oxidase family protein [Candidatus Dependentiae bacterium]MBU4386972.1 pyridoxamine 5'-phosphate oxidase family protein [Candidatus Dependentiae bacterium]MCG2755960.1 pyridoxamine 5'-phosphate oxidase family protein [Candidatus Dependentiae bacterium]
MAKHVGVKLPEDLVNLLKRKKTVAILATFSEKGVPNTTPVQCIYPKGDESLLLTIHKEHTGYRNMVWQKKIMLCFLGEGNVAYSVLGRAGVVRAPSMVHPLMNVVRIDTIDIKSDRSILTRVDQGVLWSFTSTEADELIKSLFKELEDLAKTL